MNHRRSAAEYRLSLLASLLLAAACSSPTAPAGPDPLIGDGEPCRRDEQCESGLCALLAGDGAVAVCRRSCELGCGDGEVCTTVTVGVDGKVRAACVPERAGLCRNCESDADCPYPADACLRIAGATFCGRDCAFDGSCPSGYTCADGVGSGGQKVARQCLPASGTCACLPATVGQKRACEKKNEHGTCAGQESCGTDLKFTACDARQPAAESCNGVDDDCDGATDEDIPEQDCGVGECHVRVAGCVAGAVPACVPLSGTNETCNARDDDCDGSVDEDFDLATDPTNCGSCGNACPSANGTASCVAGHCEISGCSPGFADCDGLASTGCETDTRTSLAHCGSCNNACPQEANATSSCAAGKCGYSCSAPWQDCNGLPGDGCESNRTSDPAHCGSCATSCPSPSHASATCNAGACGMRCTAPWLDCNGLPGDGCERDSSSDVNHCGACARTCTGGANSTASCSAGTCKLACSAGYADCDGLTSTGCERSLNPRAAPPQCAGFVDLGTMSGDTGAAVITRTGYGEQTFKVHLSENSSSCVYLSLVTSLQSPAGLDYDLHTSLETCGTGQPAHLTAGGAGGRESIGFCNCDGCSGEDSGFDVYLEVSYASGAACGSWTLTLEGNVAVTTCENGC